MVKNFAFSLALLVAVGCASSPLHPTDTASTGGTGLSHSTEADSYILLSSPTAVRDIDWMKPVRDFNVRGVMTNRGFTPVSKVEGNGKFCADGKDWLSLSDAKVHKAGDGKAPEAPFLYGCATNNGFEPASRDIVLQ
ncbi:MAG TPA: hypothetical protein VEZ11_15090 [Thermoanaerobaculia bacterium]|nr:hypothetical protein [Thermoanaerobaculia bacterium]